MSATDRQVRVTILKGLATHQLELVHQQRGEHPDFLDYEHALHVVLGTVAEYTGGISAATRAEQWSSFVAAYEVVRDLGNGFYDTAPVLAYANLETSDPLDSYDRVRVMDEAVNAMADALDRLFDGRTVLMAVAS